MNKQRLAEKRLLINLIRQFFDGQGFFEIETPLLVPSPGMETHLHGFKTSYRDIRGASHVMFLPTSPEFSIKKALGAGYEKVYEIARVFRNVGELGPLHHPEFNMLEWYRPGNYLDIMDDVEALLSYISKSFPTDSHLTEMNWTGSMQRTSILECFQKYAGLDLEAGMRDISSFRKAGEAVLSQSIPADDTFEDIFFRIWLQLIEPKLGQLGPEIVYDYPASMSALAQLKKPERKWAERFELYIKGIELGNAFSELRDPDEQRLRFETSNRERKRLGYEPHPIDEDLINSISSMKPTGGIAIGIERLLMTLTGEKDISQFFIQPLTVAKRK